jgi:hypothetical protein
MLLSSMKSLVEGPSSGSPLEVFTSFSGARCTDGTLWVKFTAVMRNVGDRKIILYREPLRNSQARFGATEAAILADKYEKRVFLTSEKVDLANNESFIMLSPGMAYSHEQEYPILGLDPKGKAAVQFLFFTWPLGQKSEVDAQRSRWGSIGDLYADSIVAAPPPLKIDPKVLRDCPPK